MLIIVGLGNPGTQYERTRHNVGFMAVDALARRAQISFTERRAKALVGTGNVSGTRLVLAKPQTFMNLSGESVVGLCQWYKADPQHELLVIYDELDIPFGTLRLRERGSAGTHNGMRSIVQLLGSPNFMRLRIGIGPVPAGRDTAGFVLGRFGPDEEPRVPEIITAAVEAAEHVVRQGVTAAMNLVNAPEAKKSRPPSDA